MTRKISGHDGDLVVTSGVEVDGRVTGRLVVEPGGSVVIRGSAVGPTLTVGGTPETEGGHGTPRTRVDDVIGEVP